MVYDQDDEQEWYRELVWRDERDDWCGDDGKEPSVWDVVWFALAVIGGITLLLFYAMVTIG